MGVCEKQGSVESLQTQDIETRQRRRPLIHSAGGVVELASALWGTGVKEDDRYKCTKEEKVQGPNGRMTDLEG
jgi:hypothetical protein